VKLAGGVPVVVKGEEARGFKVTPGQLEAAITPRTKVLIINSPSNPAGHAYSPAELTERSIFARLDANKDNFVTLEEAKQAFASGGVRAMPAVRALARKLGAEFDDGVWSQIAIGAIGASDETQAARPSMQQVYAELKKALSDFADADTSKVSADTVLAKIMKPDDAQGKRHVRQRLLRAFRDADLSLSVKDLDKADTVRDLAKLIKERVGK
jgi:histidinol-phosphate/aromatic aminotransferase/cobyric acid decarboxylase-like protein